MTISAEEMIDQLRKRGENNDGNYTVSSTELFNCAADQIETLRADNERLHGLIEYAKGGMFIDNMAYALDYIIRTELLYEGTGTHQHACKLAVNSLKAYKEVKGE